MTQHEALTFPELLETVPNDAYLTTPEGEREARIIPVGRYCHNAAAELRRLHAENEALEAQRNFLHKGAQELTQTLQDRLDKAREQRNALLQALKLVRPMLIAQLEAAIKAVEGEGA